MYRHGVWSICILQEHLQLPKPLKCQISWPTHSLSIPYGHIAWPTASLQPVNVKKDQLPQVSSNPPTITFRIIIPWHPRGGQSMGDPWKLLGPSPFIYLIRPWRFRQADHTFQDGHFKGLYPMGYLVFRMHENNICVHHCLLYGGWLLIPSPQMLPLGWIWTFLIVPWCNNICFLWPFERLLI